MQNKHTDESLETPYTSLRQLSSVLASQATRPSPLIARKTPVSTRRTLSQNERNILKAGLTPKSITKNPPTPHTARALQKAATPRQSARKVLKRKKSYDTPQDILRKLSRALPLYSEETKTNTYSLQNELENTYEINGLDEEIEDIEPPNINIPEPEISSDDISQPHLSIPLDQEYTVQSIEIGRRTEMKKLNDRLSLEKDSDHIIIYHEQGLGDTSFNEFTLQNDMLESENLFKDDLTSGFNRSNMIEDDSTHLKINFINEKTPTIAETISFKDMHPELSLPEHTKSTMKPPSKSSVRSNKSKIQKLSRYGIPLPSLPSAFVKQLVANFTTSKISKDALKEIILASDQFFEQVSEDLEAFAAHAGRKTIEDSDVIQLMRR
ncbi:uncharacterized protein T551_02384 [Pneumocystis jirovecii RU7]|uniref:CENP-T/Histone H4 histone fold domain-containing protein n=1 Tax=Pneumocystis jirovecii (strain RU7) TaxID=1408657 RepID=A0A0W4ZLC7_PNEJ7|nr:uncharacterized protein T551_02384 [Pneumocystis jirovecii RU7]KTW29110.1 hypothetical protein T551_02384 [Pneumocystis jirovecii RU7]